MMGEAPVVLVTTTSVHVDAGSRSSMRSFSHVWNDFRAFEYTAGTRLDQFKSLNLFLWTFH